MEGGCDMKYIGMPFGMWTLFVLSFRNQLTAVFGYDTDTAKAITKKAKTKYRKIISELPEFERGDRFRMNLVNCAMIGAFILSMPKRPDIEPLTATPIPGTWSFTNTPTAAATRDASPNAASVC